MKIGIVGSRNYPWLEDVDAFVDSLNEGDVVVSGGAWGVDRRAQAKATDRGLGTQVFLPDWQGEGKSAGYKRNVFIVEESDYVVAYWDGVSVGTTHSIRITHKAGKPLTVIIGNQVRHFHGGEAIYRHYQRSGVC